MLARQPLLTMRNFASLAGSLFDQLAIERADVLGLSFGGMVAQQLAHDMPPNPKSGPGFDVMWSGRGAQ